MALSRSSVEPEVQELLDGLGHEVRKGDQPDLVKTFGGNQRENYTGIAALVSVALKEQRSVSELKEPLSTSQKQTLVAESRSQVVGGRASMLTNNEPSRATSVVTSSRDAAPTGLQEREVEEKLRS